MQTLDDAASLKSLVRDPSTLPVESSSCIGIKLARKSVNRMNNPVPGATNPAESAGASAYAKPNLPGESFPIVGIGASAGGLEAVTELLSSVPAENGMAFLLAQHLDPHHASMLVEILGKKTAMVVVEATEGISVVPDHVYVIPPNTSMRIVERHLTLRPRPETRGPAMPIDDLLESLAEDQGANAIGVILSGSGSDGALAMQKIKSEGGTTFAQDDHSARFTGMPRAAVSLGCIDFVLPPKDIARELARLTRHPYLVTPGALPEVEADASDEASFRRILNALKRNCNVDFTHYKHGTIRRRLGRRMAVHRLDSVSEYTALLESSSAEAQALCQDLLIRVTEFFRDRETFDALAKSVFPRFMARRSSKMPVRIWVPGCASGEEVYSIAICLLEYLGEGCSATQIQIFGSDVSDSAIEAARAGLYIESIARDVSEERLRRYFVQSGNRYRIAKSVRDLCVFARQDVTHDPPFSKLDLVSCRNLLIYLDPVLQKRAIQLFHYALNPEGILMLGRSETVGSLSDLFAPLDDKRFKIYAKKGVAQRRQLDVSEERSTRWQPDSKASALPVTEPAQRTMETSKEDLLRRTADRIALARYAPASVLCDDELNILEFRGDTTAFLAHAPGPPSLNLNKLARRELLAEISEAIREARRDAAPVRKDGLRIEGPGQVREVSMEVIPIRSMPLDNASFLIFFEGTAPRSAPAVAAPAGLIESLRAILPGSITARAHAARNSKLEHQVLQLTRELEATRAHMRANIEEFEITREELQSAQEELLSSNEEFQSTNEELETAKEELQSTNEELTTTNDELRQRNIELNQLNDELRHAQDYSAAIVETVREPLLLLDGDLRVLRANEAFYSTFKTTRAQTEQCLLYELGKAGDRSWDSPNLRRLLEEVLPNDTIISDFEVTHDFPGIGEKSIRINATRLVWPGISQILLAMEDITDRVAVLDALKQSGRHKDEFLAMLAHELRGPLAPIRNAFEIWRGGNASESALRQAQTIMHRQLQNISLLVDDLIDMARINSDAIELRTEPVDLILVAQQAAENTRHHFDLREHQLTVDLPDDALMVEGDVSRLVQIVANLLTNAAKYTTRRGRISLTLERQETDALLTIVDNGIGIAPALLPVIFELFTQAERSLDRTEGGLGIGLSIARRLAQMHGGAISAASKGLSHGSTFTLRLPLLTQVDKRASVATAAPPITIAPRRILVVDDNADTTESLALLLQLDGHDVRATLEGHSAIASAQAFRPQVVLLDIGMPDLDGFEVARHLRTLPETKHALLIALTGYAQPEDRELSMAAGFDHHLAKPLEYEQLKILIAALPADSQLPA